MNFFNSNGDPMRMPLATVSDDMTGVPSIGFQGILSPGGYGAQVTVQNGSRAAIGYAVVTMEPAESVAVNATFVNLVPGKPPFMAGIPLSSALHKTAFMPFLADRGFTPSLALVSLEAQEVTLIARSGSTGGSRALPGDPGVRRQRTQGVPAERTPVLRGPRDGGHGRDPRQSAAARLDRRDRLYRA